VASCRHLSGSSRRAQRAAAFISINARSTTAPLWKRQKQQHISLLLCLFTACLLLSFCISHTQPFCPSEREGRGGEGKRRREERAILCAFLPQKEAGLSNGPTCNRRKFRKEKQKRKKRKKRRRRRRRRREGVAHEKKKKEERDRERETPLYFQTKHHVPPRSYSKHVCDSWRHMRTF